MVKVITDVEFNPATCVVSANSWYISQVEWQLDAIFVHAHILQGKHILVELQNDPLPQSRLAEQGESIVVLPLDGNIVDVRQSRKNDTTNVRARNCIDI